MYCAFIMAGGVGARLWPLSRQRHPKQALRLIGEQTMFACAVDRIAPLFRPEQILVGTRQTYVNDLAALAPALPPENFIIEPDGRGTASAIGLAAIHLRHRHPDAVMAVLAADHFIADTAQFCRMLTAAEQVARAGRLVTLGIQPSAPATGYGYIKQGAHLETVQGRPVFRVERFTEKPDLETATRMVASGNYAWNSGMFIWRVDRLLEAMHTHMPALHAQLTEIAATLGTPDYAPTRDRIWPQVAEQTIDYGVMEKAEEVVVIPVDIGWSDVGSWTSLLDLLPVDEDGNTAVGPHVAIDTHNSLIFGGKRLIATIGLEDMVIVDTEDALMICPKAREQEVREVVKKLREHHGGKWV